MVGNRPRDRLRGGNQTCARLVKNLKDLKDRRPWSLGSLQETDLEADSGAIVKVLHRPEQDPRPGCRELVPREREFFIDNLLVRIHFIIVMIWWTGLAPWESCTGRSRIPDPGAESSYLQGYLAHKKRPTP